MGLCQYVYERNKGQPFTETGSNEIQLGYNQILQLFLRQASSWRINNSLMASTAIKINQTKLQPFCDSSEWKEKQFMQQESESCLVFSYAGCVWKIYTKKKRSISPKYNIAENKALVMSKFLRFVVINNQTATHD